MFQQDAFLKAHVEVATTSCQQSAYETHAGMLDGVVRMQMILWRYHYVRLVAGLHVHAYGMIIFQIYAPLKGQQTWYKTSCIFAYIPPKKKQWI